MIRSDNISTQPQHTQSRTGPNSQPLSTFHYHHLPRLVALLPIEKWSTFPRRAGLTARASPARSTREYHSTNSIYQRPSCNSNHEYQHIIISSKTRSKDRGGTEYGTRHHPRLGHCGFAVDGFRAMGHSKHSIKSRASYKSSTRVHESRINDVIADGKISTSSNESVVGLHRYRKGRE